MGYASRAHPRSFGFRPRTSPLLVFISAFFSRLLILFCKLTAALIQGRGRPSGNARGAKPYALAPEPARVRAGSPHPCAREIPAVRNRARRLPILYIFNFYDIVRAALVTPTIR